MLGGVLLSRLTVFKYNFRWGSIVFKASILMV